MAEQVELPLAGGEAGRGQGKTGDRVSAPGRHFEQPLSGAIQLVAIGYRPRKQGVPLARHAVIEREPKLETARSTLAPFEPPGETPSQKRHRAGKAATFTAIGASIETANEAHQLRRLRAENRPGVVGGKRRHLS